MSGSIITAGATANKVAKTVAYLINVGYATVFVYNTYAKIQ